MSVRVELECDSGEFTTRMIYAGQTVRQFQQSVGQGIVSVKLLNESNQSLLGTLRDLTVTLGMARAAIENVSLVTKGWAAEIVKVNAEMEKLGFLLRGMSNAADPIKDATDQVKYLREEAKSAPFSLSGLTDTFVKMKATGIDPMKGGFKALIDGVAAFGGTDDVMKRATIAITQMAGKGVIQMEELRQQLGEAMPRAVEIMARSMGVSTGQLIQTISKGTLDAKSSLQAFFIETERTFGGAALEQMQTFNGRVAQMNTLFQNLALKAGEAGFFDAVKKQLGDLNTFLSSKQAERYGTALGQALTVVVEKLRSAIDFLMSFGAELTRIGYIVASGLGFYAFSSTINGFVSGFGNIITSVRSFTLAWQAAQRSLMFTDFAQKIGQIQGFAGGISMAEATTRRFATIIPLLAMGLSTVTGLLLPLGALLISAGLAFGWFSNSSQDAYNHLVKFGAETQKQVDDAIPFVKAIEKKIEVLRKYGQIQVNPVTGQATFTDADPAEIARLEAQRKEAQKVIDASQEQANKRFAERELQAQNDAVSAEIRTAQKGYDEKAKASANAYNDALKEANKNRTDTQKLEADYQAEHKKNLLASLQAEYDVRENAIQAVHSLASEGNAKALAIQDTFTQEQVKKQVQLSEQMATIRKLDLKPQELEKSVNIDKLVERAKSKLDDVQSGIAGFKAELAGASGEYAKLAYMIESAQAKNKYFGPLSNEQIKEVTNSLREQQQVYDALEKQVTGQRKFDADLKSLHEKTVSDYVEAISRGKSDIDKIAIKKMIGVYGDNPTGAMQTGLGGITQAANNAAQGMQKAFGETMLGNVNNLIKAVTALKGGLDGLSTAGGATDWLRGTGHAFATFTPGSNYAQNLMRRESSMDPNAKSGSSTAYGLGQFIESTWMQFLNQMHPDMVQTMSREGALARRSDPALMQEAVEWYATQNAKSLSKGGVEVNDANLYLAHFLGPDGAVNALSRASNTLLSAIPGLEKARAANPGVFRDLMTVGDLKAWAQSFMGTGMTARMTANSSNLMGYLQTSLGQDSPAYKQIQADEGLKNLTTKINQQNELNDAAKEYANWIASAADNQQKDANWVQKTVERIRNGDFGDKNPEAEQYRQILELAKQRDEVEKRITENKKIRSKLTGLAESGPRDAEVDAQRIEELKRQFDSQNKFRFSNRYFAALREQEKTNSLVDKGLDRNVIQPDEAEQLRAAAAAKVKNERDIEVAQTIVAEQQKNDAIQKSLMTADDARTFTFNKEVQRLQQLAALTSDNAELRGRIEETIQKKIDLFRKQTMMSSPLGKLMKDWSDLGENLQKGAASWLDQTADKLADFVTTGKANFADLASSISKSLASIAIKAAFGNMLSSWFGLPVGGSKGGAKTSGGSAPMSILPPIHHMGGVAGANMPYRSVSAAAFANAPRFHTGSMGGTIGGDEIPIIAKRGEQIDWPENLARQYGGGSVIAPTIAVSVQGSPGMSEADHQRMGETVGKAAMVHVKRMIGEELFNQRRQGGIYAR